jgi:uncharacterized protein YggE
MTHYIDLVTTADYTETVSTYRADLDLSVRAAKDETALAEVAALRQECLHALLAAGLTSDEMTEGGGQAWQPWYWRKKERVGQEASLRVLLEVDDMARLQKALAALEPLFENARRTLSVSMRQPEFVAADGARQAAEHAAVTGARERADRLAAAAGVRVVGVAELEELGVARSRTGAHGDEEWRGARMMVAGAAVLEEGGEDISLEAASRTVTVRFRVRFATQP